MSLTSNMVPCRSASYLIVLGCRDSSAYNRVRLRVPPPSGLDLLASRYGTKLMSSCVYPASRVLQRRAEIDLLHKRVGLDLVCEAVGDDLPVVQDRDPIGQLEGDVHVVLDDQQGDLRVELLEQRGHQLRLGGREPGRWVVQQSEP